MDRFHERLARHALAALEPYGFVLAGGYAFHLHQVTDRLSRDVDLFTDRFDPEVFDLAEQAVLEAYRDQGFMPRLACHSMSSVKLWSRIRRLAWKQWWTSDTMAATTHRPA